MDLYEYQARELLRRHGVPVLHGEVATDPDTAEQIVTRLLSPQCPPAKIGRASCRERV